MRVLNACQPRFKRIMTNRPARHEILILRAARCWQCCSRCFCSAKLPSFPPVQPARPIVSQPNKPRHRYTTKHSGKPKQEAPAEAGGPTAKCRPLRHPEKKSRDAPPPPPPPLNPKKVEGMPDYSIKVNVPLVNVDVLVTTKSGQFVPGLKKDNFRLFEDGPLSRSLTSTSPKRRSLRCCSWSMHPRTTCS